MSFGWASSRAHGPPKLQGPQGHCPPCPPLGGPVGGMNLDHDFVQVWKFSKDQKKIQMEHFFPQIQVKTKKKVFIKNRTFSPNSSEDQKKGFNQK